MSELLVGRQPIFNGSLKLVGYELLYRTFDSNHAIIDDGDKATTQVILNTFTAIGLQTLVGKSTAFINATRNFLTGKYPIPFPPEQIVLEILEDIILDDELIVCLRTLSRHGFKFALDDVISTSGISQVCDLISILKIDTQAASQTQILELVSTYKMTSLKLLAEKVETLECFEYYKQLGFDYFQGYFFSKPNIVKRKKLDTSRIVVLNILAELQDPNASFGRMEKIISQDVALSYKLLKLVNSAHYSIPSQVKSISQAISFVGLNQLRGWLTLFLIASIENKPHELTNTAMIRAKMCELSAKYLGYPEPDTYFMIGLLSILDAMMDVPMHEIILQLPLSDEIARALTKHEGKFGQLLKAIIAYEKGDWKNAIALCIPPTILGDMYIQSLYWVSLFDVSK